MNLTPRCHPASRWPRSQTAAHAVAHDMITMPNDSAVSSGTMRSLTDILQNRANAATGMNPEDPVTLSRAGLVLLQAGRGSEAAGALEKAYNLQPAPELAFNLALARLVQHQPKDARALLESIVQSRPEWAIALNEMAWLLATCPDETVRDGQKAVAAAEKAVALTGRKEARFLGTLDAAYAEAGRFEDAIRTAAEAKAVAEKAGQTEISAAAESRLKLYQAGKPYRQQ